MADDKFCHCFVSPDDGKVVGCHLSVVNDSCGGYITDTMFKKIDEQNRG